MHEGFMMRLSVKPEIIDWVILYFFSFFETFLND
jgi:hypothetical protein